MTETWQDRQRQARERMAEGGRRGGPAAAAKMTPAERSARARAGAKASRSGPALARALVRAWLDMSPEERQTVIATLRPLQEHWLLTTRIKGMPFSQDRAQAKAELDRLEQALAQRTRAA